MRTGDLIGWLETRPVEIKYFQGPNIPDYPDKMCVVTPAPGGGLDVEMSIDNPAWQLRVIGPQGDPNATASVTEDLIYAIEAEIILNAPRVVMGGKRVKASQRFGSQPTNLPPDTAGRVHFVVTVLLTTESGY